MGHSEGGIITPIVASRNKKVKFIVLLAGTGVDGKALMLEQYRLILKATSIPDSIIDPLVDLNRQAFDVAMTISDNAKAANKIREITDSTIQKVGEETSKKYNLSKKTAELLVMQVLNPWMKEFIRLNPADYLCKVNCPILALNGESDLQVPMSQNIPAIQKAVAKNKNGKLTVKTFPKLNHLFQTANTGSPSEYARIEETFNEEVLKVILKFIQEL
jgi:pimeloyl-ACP methyl ester carboxylesterase